MVLPIGDWQTTMGFAEAMLDVRVFVTENPHQVDHKCHASRVTIKAT
jgi:hypothetical protein